MPRGGTPAPCGIALKTGPALVLLALAACGTQEHPQRLSADATSQLPAAATFRPDERPDAWSIERDTSLVDGRMTVTLRRLATEPADTGFWSLRPALVIRCQEGQTEIFVTVPTGLDAEQMLKGAPVGIAFDSLPPVKQRWLASSAGDAVFSPGADAFLAQLKLSDTVHLSITGRGDSAQVSSFAVVGLSEPLRRLAPECLHANWPMAPTTIN